MRTLRLLSQTGAHPNSVITDAVGNITQTGGRTYLYAPDQRLASVKQGSSDIARYSYDAQGRRRSKTVGTATTHYDYDLQGRLLGEDRVPADYVYLDGEPLARVDYNLSDWSGNVASWNIAYYHNNPLGAPLQTTDRLGQISWSAQLDPFGKATPVNPAITQNLRFPGQYYDQETGLHYNMARYYDPNNGGRYLQSDPIGLSGGINTYAYALNNPLRYTDPLGLRPPNAAESAFINNYFGKCLDPQSLDINAREFGDTSRALSMDGGFISFPTNYFIGNALNNGLNLSNPRVAGVFGHESLHQVQRNAGVSVTAYGLALQPLYTLSFGLIDPYSYTESTDPNQMLQTFLDGNPELQGQMFQNYIERDLRKIDTSPFQGIAGHVKNNCSCGAK